MRPTTTPLEILTYEPRCGEKISASAQAAIHLSREERKPVHFDFNGVSITVFHGSNPDTVVKGYHSQVEENRRAHINSPEYRRAENKRKRAKRASDRAAPVMS